jgi:GT2 family glycosyltransferase
MSRASLPVVAAIPNYNMAASLGELLPQLTSQNYADIFVLDDASTDHSRDVAADFSDITFVAGAENAGAGANRNRIQGALGYNAIIHFIDADMDSVTPNVPEVAQDVLSERAGFVGGLIRQANGLQHFFNFGPRQSLKNDFTSLLQMHAGSMAGEDIQRAKAIRERFPTLLKDWPDLASEPQPRRVFWNAEANLLIRSDVFASVGGFDPRLRDHEIQDLAIRLHDAGFEQRFDPALEARHKEVQVRSGNRNLQMLKAEWQITRKHGLRGWLLPAN